MINTRSYAMSFLFVSHLIFAMASFSFSCPVYDCESQLNLTLYMHQVFGGPNSRNEIAMLNGTNSNFGGMAIHDWPLLNAPAPDATIVARAKGMHVQADLQGKTGYFTYHSILFQDTRFNGSTLLAMGFTSSDCEWGILSGTGQFANAHGIIKVKTVNDTIPFEIYRQVDIHAFFTTGPITGTSTATSDSGRR